MNRYFIAIGDDEHKGQGWPMAFVSGNSQTDNKDWSIETVGLKGDEVPGECCDSMTFSQLVAGLLNCFYNNIETKNKSAKTIIRMGKPEVKPRIKKINGPEIPF